MCVGVLIGLKCFPERFTKYNVRLQLVCTGVLIFSMGVSLGSRPNFFKELATLGIESLALALLAIAFSVALVYFLTKWLMEGKK